MKITAKQLSLPQVKVDCAVVYLPKGKTAIENHIREIGKSLRAIISPLLQNGDFTGAFGQTIPIYNTAINKIGKVIIIGYGTAEENSIEEIRRLLGKTVNALQKTRATSAVLLNLPKVQEQVQWREYGMALAEGAFLAAYSFKDYIKKAPNDDAAPPLKELIILSKKNNHIPLSKGIKIGTILAEGSNHARTLLHTPANKLRPVELEKAARAIAHESGLKIKVFKQKDLIEKKFGGILAVNKGSTEQARFIILEYTPTVKNVKTICLIGKGITFDSGGISLKPSSKMWEMKYDMGGAAAVLGALYSLGKLKPSIRIIGLIPTTENMPDGNALKPGDVITAFNKKTIEVLNTDAEGRLILADALGYATRYKPDAVIDAATLTGACVVALGHEAAAVLGNSPALIEQIIGAAAYCGEKVWPLPLWKTHKKRMKSTIANISNISDDRAAGTITAGAFLHEFVDEQYPWAHLDIAGTAWIPRSTDYLEKGPTGFGARLMAQLVLNFKSVPKNKKILQLSD